MGQRNPDRVPVWARRAKCETVGQMYAQRWDVRSKCEACGLQMQVDLVVLIKVSGPQLSLWGRRPRCRRIGCGGRVQFLGRAPGMSWHEALRSPDPEFEPEPPAWLRGLRPG